jgi:hypothetical protein
MTMVTRREEEEVSNFFSLKLEHEYGLLMERKCTVQDGWGK